MKVIFSLATLLVLAAAPAGATIIPLTASLDCAQAATCGLGGTGTGSGSITLDDTTNLLSWVVTWSGLSAPTVAAHFHGPALPGVPAGVQVGITAVSPSVGSTVISASQAADLLAGLWYLNIHSSAFPGGEIRGQVVPEPSTALLLAAGLVALAARGRARAC